MYWKVENENKERRKKRNLQLSSFPTDVIIIVSHKPKIGLQIPPKLLFFHQQFSTSIHCPKIEFNIIPNAVRSKLTPDVFLLAILIPIYTVYSGHLYYFITAVTTKA
jgi:hypothetical protein